jgi:hypothetical protein
MQTRFSTELQKRLVTQVFPWVAKGMQEPLEPVGVSMTLPPFRPRMGSIAAIVARKFRQSTNNFGL